MENPRKYNLNVVRLKFRKISSLGGAINEEIVYLLQNFAIRGRHKRGNCSSPNWPKECSENAFGDISPTPNLPQSKPLYPQVHGSVLNTCFALCRRNAHLLDPCITACSSSAFCFANKKCTYQRNTSCL